MYRVPHLLRTCKYATENKFYSNATSSIIKLIDVFESLNLGEVTISKPLITVTSPSFVGITIEDQHKMVTDRLPEKLRNKMNFQTIVQEAVGEVSPVVLNKVEKLSKTRILETPQAHLDEAVYFVSRREADEAFEQLWFCANLAMKNLAKKGGIHPKSDRAESVLVDFFRDHYKNKEIDYNWSVIKRYHIDYYDEYTMYHTRDAIDSTIELCNILYKLHKSQEFIKKRVIEPEEFKRWFEKHYSGRLTDHFYGL